MADKDTVAKEFMSDAAHFADAFNFYMFGGEKKITPDQLRPFQTSDTALPHSTDSVVAPIQRHRDVMKELTMMTDDHAAYALLGIENQSDVHYAMPVRNMMYDAMTYSAQVRVAANAHRKSQDAIPSNAEWLSGWYKTDSIKPVVTLVVYFGAEPWDGPMSLTEMMNMSNAAIQPYVQDYKIFVIAPNTIDDADFDKFHTDLRELLKFIKYSKDKTKLETMVSEDERFRHVDRSTADAINIITGSNMKFADGEEEIDMCKAISDIRLEERTTALAESKVEDLISVMKRFNVSLEEAMDALNISTDHRAAYREMVEAAQS